MIYVQKTHNFLNHYHPIAKHRYPVLTGAVEVETKTILAQTCAEYDWSLKAIEVMPEHAYLFLEASPGEAPSHDSAYSEIDICSTYLYSLYEAKGAQVLGIRTMVEGMLLRECRRNHRGKREKVHKESEVEHRMYRMIRKQRVAGMIAIAAIVLFIVADMLFSLNLPRQNFFTHLIAFICILFIGWCFLSRPRK